MNLLYIGRFQPFHNGHADAVQQICKTMKSDDTLFIGIGSAENNFMPENPLTAGERFEAIKKALCDIEAPIHQIHIIPIRNISHHSLWPHHVQQYLPPIHSFFSGSPLVRQLWKSAFPQSSVHALVKNIDISATVVREHLVNKDSITQFIPPSVMQFLEEKNIAKRLADMGTE